MVSCVLEPPGKAGAGEPRGTPRARGKICCQLRGHECGSFRIYAGRIDAFSAARLPVLEYGFQIINTVSARAPPGGVRGILGSVFGGLPIA